jgi:predicted NBD/HSP70 family sugar kinase
LGDKPTEQIAKRELDKLLDSDDAETAALVHSAVEEFGQELASVLRAFLRLKGWHKTERVVVGGGFRQSRVGELAVARAQLLLKAEEVDVALAPIRHDPDEAGLMGAAYLFPGWAFAGHDAILAVDIGGSNIRIGVVAIEFEKGIVKKTKIECLDLWRHADETSKRDEAVERLLAMLQKGIARAKRDKLKLAPFIGIGCPGIIAEDGTIERGSQNLPGKWDGSFNLPRAIKKAIPEIGGHETVVLMHNDAVVQGLSELPRMRDVERWGVLTIGTGLGNARFTNRKRRENGKH